MINNNNKKIECRFIKFDEISLGKSLLPGLACFRVHGGGLRLYHYDSLNHAIHLWDVNEEEEEDVMGVGGGAGKFRVKARGVYELDENIILNKNADNLFMPLAFDPNDEDIFYTCADPNNIVMFDTRTRRWRMVDGKGTRLYYVLPISDPMVANTSS
ncbi:hypothetical protein GBA52_011542 [Prunus armeniaca]|nr:hypothetical protein GBA52_011542 [Prunus armeniaca]